MMPRGRAKKPYSAAALTALLFLLAGAASAQPATAPATPASLPASAPSQVPPEEGPKEASEEESAWRPRVFFGFVTGFATALIEHPEIPSGFQAGYPEDLIFGLELTSRITLC